MSKFNGKVAVVTGGNSGIGLATAKVLAANGAKVVITGRDQKTLDAAVKEIGGETLGVKTDISKLSEIENLFAEASEKFGKIDILFVNAGGGKFAPLEQSDEALFDEVVDTNFKGSYFTVKYASPHLNDGASIIFTTTVAAKTGMPRASVYGASKAALHALTKIFAAELVGRKIRVNAVSPGPIDTPIFDRMGIPAEAKADAKAGIVAQVPMKRMGTIEEVAKTVAFLASDDAGFITGVDLDVDGGMARL
ncbi:MAG: SDR family oxidoreductase [Pyrinomonadaceae bacterium]|nr:SDR family oxidoreductase [Pyrinomonadaceae bacterium]